MEIREVTPTELWDEYKLLLGAADGFAYDIPVPNSDKGINALAYAMAQGLNFVSVDHKLLDYEQIIVREIIITDINNHY